MRTLPTMIDQAIGYLRREVRDLLGLPDAEILTGNVHTLRNDSSSRGIYISLVNVEEESSFTNRVDDRRLGGSTRLNKHPVILNLSLLFAFDFEDYDVGLEQLSNTIELFLSKPVLSKQTETPTNPFPSELEGLTLHLQNLELEQLDHLWSVLGGAGLPSLLYKARLVRERRSP